MASAITAKIAAQTVAGAVPVISVVAMAVLFIRDFAKIKGAIITFYDSYKVAAP